MNDDDLERYYTARELRMIEARQRDMRWEWFLERHRRSLPVIALISLGIAAMALAIILGVN